MTENGDTNTVQTKPAKSLDLDDILVNQIGEFGKFQLTNLFLLFIPMLLCGLLNEYIFGTAVVPHRCMIPECGEESKGLTYYNDWASDAIPKDSNGKLSSCKRFVPINGTRNGTIDSCPASLFNEEVTIECEGYVYARENSVVYEFDLACKDWLRAMAGTFYNLGTLLALPFIGYFSDRYGRRITMVISVFNTVLLGIIRAFSVNYLMYMILQLLQTTLGSGIYTAAFILATEMLGPKYRVVIGMLCPTMFSLGQILLGVMAWCIQPWRHLIIGLHIPFALLIFHYWLVPESVRWLLSKGKHEEAKKILEKVARANNKQISEKSLEALTNPPEIPLTQKQNDDNIFKVIIKSPVMLRRVCTIPIWWITTTFVYYGLSIYSTSVSSNMYVSFILGAVIDLPGYFTAILLVNWVGRKYTICGGFFLSAAANAAFAFIKPELSIVRLCIYLVGKYSISAVFSSLYLYTLELYPTQYRHRLLAFSSMIGRVGSITAPLTLTLATFWSGIPSLMFASMGVLSGLLVLTQPETLQTRLPDTVFEAETLGKP
ncbi:hypothetical protein ACJJTC_015573 [Scirpophaga incertulas]